MKNLQLQNVLIKTLLIVGAMVEARSSQAQSNPSRRFDFDKPFVLTAQNLNMNVNWRQLVFKEKDERWEDGEYKRKQNRWEVRRDDSRIGQCDTKIEILGRDLATSNPLIGEHYYGRMEFNCKSAGSSWKPFRTRFERVLFLGVRNCVESETTVDSDYCELSVVAFRRHSDMSQDQGDLSKNRADLREEYGLAGAKEAGLIVSKYGLTPQGLAPETVNSTQFFRVLINQKGNEFIVPGDSKASGFHVQNHIFKVDPATFANDEKLRDQIHANLSSLEAIVSRFQNSGPNTDEQIKAISEFVTLYNQTARAILQVVSPAEFFRLDRQLAELNALLAESIKAQVTTQNAPALAKRLQDYERIASFIRDRSSSDLKYHFAIELKDIQRAPKTQPAPEPKRITVDSALGTHFQAGPVLPFGNAAQPTSTGLSVKVKDSELGEGRYYEVSITDLGGVPENAQIIKVGSVLLAKDYLFVEKIRTSALPEGIYNAESTVRALALRQCRQWITDNISAADQSKLACRVSSWSSDEGWMAEAVVSARSSTGAVNTTIENP